MLSDKLNLFYQLVNEAVGVHGLNAKAVADVVITEAFPDTMAAASHEGADTMLRNGVIAFLSAYFKRAPSTSPMQLELEIPPSLTPIVQKLKKEAHYVESLGQYVPVPILISNPEWLDDARRYKRVKGEQTLAEADVLDELYHAVINQKSD